MDGGGWAAAKSASGSSEVRGDALSANTNKKDAAVWNANIGSG